MVRFCLFRSVAIRERPGVEGWGTRIQFDPHKSPTAISYVAMPRSGGLEPTLNCRSLYIFKTKQVCEVGELYICSRDAISCIKSKGNNSAV